MWKKCCPESRKLRQEEMNKQISECCGTEDVSDPEKTQESLRNCCGQHSKQRERKRE